MLCRSIGRNVNRQMSKILIDVSRLLFRRFANRLPTGIDRVSLEYLRHYVGTAHAVLSYRGLLIALPRKESEHLFRLLYEPSGHRLKHWLYSPRLIIALFKTTGSSELYNGAILFNTGHIGLGDERYAMGMRGVKLVFMVHDLIPITHPEYFRPGELKKHTLRMRNVLRIAHGIVTNSKDTMANLCDFSKNISREMPPSVVAPLAPGLTRLKPAVRPIAEPYFVVLSTIEPRKNHLMLLQLWRRLREESGENVPRLVVIGQRGWECENVVDHLERSELLAGYVFEFSRCGDVELATFLHHAQALLFPSFVEGYGMPLIEALAQGVPVIASDLAVFREFAAEIPEYADPLDGQHWLALIKEYSKPDSERRSAQLTRIKSFRLPTWEQHFAQLDSLLLRLDDVNGV